eukprot:CAMPEP_0170528442 /NCGR_PEP_ID=MMETSP0209-20121228/13935_1 /TAXON_ID=665100 ORGANISM="Litonotus pictus, Strain P1" /NCGR_SAMPLE_ID=MMETSP0209 /ASSEMBLY_ACC=CAM_ASM_000301 /LENGTH=280 /DNA_ID=CAMNT_0010819649 /DNA_START=45 /DNA_END=887 /DNA_ORIENTATION=+
MKKKPQIGRPETKIPLVNSEKYASLWFDNQEDLDHYDSLMRKKIYFQNSYGEKGDKDFVYDGVKTTFGIFTKDFTEKVFQNSEKLNKQLSYLETLKNNEKVKEIMNRRYHSYSDYDQSHQGWKIIGKTGLLYLILRELPLRHFYARSTIWALFGFYLVTHNWKTNPFWPVKETPLYYTSKFDEQTLDNYPMVKNYVFNRIPAKKNNPGLPEWELWYKNQFPSHYMHHFKNYRYIMRSRRVVPWDGTFNQPALPYVVNNDRTGLVHNGSKEIIEPMPNSAW